jgi:tRNA(Glu) U13 pseudouridine synthase TruD
LKNCSIIGYETNLQDFPLIEQFFNQIIEKDGIDKKIFRSKLLYQFDYKGSSRAIVVKPTGLQILELSEDEYFPGKKKLKIEFSFPKGSYATMLIRELMK